MRLKLYYVCELTWGRGRGHRAALSGDWARCVSNRGRGGDGNTWGKGGGHKFTRQVGAWRCKLTERGHLSLHYKFIGLIRLLPLFEGLSSITVMVL